MIGPLTVAPGGFNHVLVAVDKFTKWIEYKLIVKISSDRVVDFISDIIHRFGFPRRVASGSKSYLTWSWGCELNLAKLLDNLLSSLHMDQKPYCWRI